MNVKELIKYLQTQDENDIVLLSKDSEGNGFGVLDCIGKHHYLLKDGEVCHEDDLDGKVPKGAKKVLILWP